MNCKSLIQTMLSFGILAGGFLSSCTVEGDPSAIVSSGMLAKSPDIKAYSGNYYWNPGTRSANVNANQWDQTWDCPPRPAKDLSDEELAELKALLSKGSPVKNTIVLPFENYYVQQIFKGTDWYHTHDRCYLETCDHVNSEEELGSDHMNKLLAYNPTEVFDYRQEDGWQGAWYHVEYEHINNFNNGDNTNNPNPCGCGKQHYQTTLMTGMPTTGIDPEKQFGFQETWGTNHDYFNYYIVEYKGYYYVGFDYEGHKFDQDTHNQGEGLDIERDWNFTDWIVRITPAYAKGTTPADNPGGIQSGDTGVGDICEACGHESHGAFACELCEERYPMEGSHSCTVDGGAQPLPDGGETPDTPDTPDQPENPSAPGTSVDKHNNEVEINLVGVEKNRQYLESHLSIHVRHAGNVEVFIPVPAKYYCAADDMEIVEKHFESAMVHGGPKSVSYEIAGNIVTLNVDFVENGIRIWTQGINEAVIAHCQRNYGDGITFEVWNYFNDSINLDELKTYLNNATVEFLDGYPEYYINAFNKTEDGSIYEDDCTVSIIDSQREFYDEATTGPHLNGSPHNEIYKKK